MRLEFPALNQKINDETFIYLDNAATTQKPKSVLESMMTYYQFDNANIHRGVHTLAQRATQQYESVRTKVAEFIGAKQANEIIFTSGTTASLNFIAKSLVEPRLNEGDLILTTKLEHHSNLVPWQVIAEKNHCQLTFMPLKDDYTVDLKLMDQFENVKAIVIQHVSNVLGTEQPIKAIAKWARKRDILVIVDGAQAVSHLPLNVEDLDIDAYCFSGHKMYGPTGVGVCYLNRRQHDVCLPFLYGGEMINFVGDTESNYKEAPWKYEGGTPPIAEVIGLGTAIDFLNSIGMSQIHQHEQLLMEQLFGGMTKLEGITLYNQGQNGILSFNINGVHPHDAATGYDMEGIAVRAGHHCAQPLMRFLGVESTLRASLAVYNTEEEMVKFIESTKKIKEFFNGTF